MNLSKNVLEPHESAKLRSPLPPPSSSVESLSSASQLHSPVAPNSSLPRLSMSERAGLPSVHTGMTSVDHNMTNGAIDETKQSSLKDTSVTVPTGFISSGSASAASVTSVASVASVTSDASGTSYLSNIVKRPVMRERRVPETQIGRALGWVA